MQLAAIAGAAWRHAPTLCILLLLSAAAFSYQSWGLPESWPPDESTIVNSVNRMLTQGTLDPGYFYYPSFMFYASYVVARVFQAVGFGHLGVSQIGGVALASRTASALFYVLTAVFVGKTVRLALGLDRAPFAVLFVGTIGALLHHAHIGTTNSGFFFCIVLALYAFARTIKTQREGAFYVAVMACSLATGAKYNGVFLFGALPAVWLLTFGRGSVALLARCAGVSLLIAPLPFLLTTPYSVLNAPLFLRDMRALLFVEGPAFKVGGVGLSQYLRFFELISFGAFSVVTFTLVTAWIAVVGGHWLLKLANKGKRGRFLSEHDLVLKLGFVYSLTLALYLAMNFQIGIYSSRYFLPASLMVALIFLLMFYWADRVITPRSGYWWLARGSVAAITLFNGINSYAHVHAFTASAKSQALPIVKAYTNAHPGARIAVITYPERSPFQRGLIDDCCEFFVTMQPVEAETWDQYLDMIGGFIRNTDADLVVFESIVTEWPVFLPERYALDFGKRLAYPNPGFPAWEQMLERSGYRQIKRLENADHRSPIELVLGPYYHWTVEGADGAVYMFERGGTP